MDSKKGVYHEAVRARKPHVLGLIAAKGETGPISVLLEAGLSPPFQEGGLPQPALLNGGAGLYWMLGRIDGCKKPAPHPYGSGAGRYSYAARFPLAIMPDGKRGVP